MSEFASYLIQIYGIVQGVGMRPTLYKMAKQYKLTGFVKNQGASVTLAISGNQAKINEFLYELEHHPPPNAVIQHTIVSSESKFNFQDFSILPSEEEQQMRGSILPDLGLCKDCLDEIESCQDRRYRYEFTNCTNCGPRYSIMKELPYDRANTSMYTFAMCPNCAEEYKNPESRRFHAQPNCCPACGPKYSLLQGDGTKIPCENIMETTKQFLKEGKIVAMKGIGGYHLVCNAEDETAVVNLRQRKKRPHKPFAIMGATLKDVKKICVMNEVEQQTISHQKRPIVLLQKSQTQLLPEIIAPHIPKYGVMLPYTPLHYFLFDEELRYLVMTSGNISGMPICYKDKEALAQLNQVADCFLVHSREIMTPIDDSVVKVLENEVLLSRCGRGYAPLALPSDMPMELLCLGGNQKASVCFLQKKTAQISQYLGNLDCLEAYEEYKLVIHRLSHLFRTNPQVIVHDLHPNYITTQYAKSCGKKTIAVQHHHAHMAGCMAEHECTENGIGIIFDGTGMGTDETIWGGEFFVGNRSTFQRVAHLEYVTLQGADSAIEEPWKCAASYLFTMDETLESYMPDLDGLQLALVKRALQKKLNCYESSSMGRFFDCVAALTLSRSHISYEAQAAIELESIVDSTITDTYSFSIFEQTDMLIIGYQRMLQGVLEDLKNQQSISVISTKFHNTICKATIDCACMIRQKNQVNHVYLSGGVFENTFLLKNIVCGLKESGFQVFFNKKVPMNDGGLSFGQAAVAASILEEDDDVPCNSD